MNDQQRQQKAIDEGRPSQWAEACREEAKRWRRIGGVYGRSIADRWDEKAREAARV